MSSFSESVGGFSRSFSNRVSIPVTGKYTQRDIYLYYDAKSKAMLDPVIDLIKRNADSISRADEERRENL